MNSRDPRPPQLGFNNNVKYAGRTFHIQTEDSGVNHPHITTHLFADGGRILKSQRTDYSELLGSAELGAIVRKRMKEQHKAMYLALRGGEFDPLIEAAFQPVAQAAPSVEDVTAVESKRAPASAAASTRRSAERAPVPAAPVVCASAEVAPRAEQAERAVAADAHETAAATEAAADDPNVKSSVRVAIAQGTPSSPSSAQPSQPGWPTHASGRYHATRPAAIFNATGPSSLFGAEPDPIDEQSLDDVILSYISEDLDTTGSE